MDIEKYRRKLEKRAAENRKAFEGEYREEVTALLALSREEIDRITTDTTDLEVYDRLITVVKEASATNIKQAELKICILELGEVAISIANHVPKLASILA
jgi:hypothetical protein